MEDVRKNTKNLAELKENMKELLKEVFQQEGKIKPQWEKQNTRNKDEPKLPPSPYIGNKNNKKNRRRKSKHCILCFVQKEERLFDF